MILVAGGTGCLGSALVPMLTADGTAVRVLTRSLAAATRLRERGVDVVVGDLRDPDVVGRAVEGCSAVVAAMTGFGPGRGDPGSVDLDGTRALATAACAAGVQHLVLLSVCGAAPDAPIPLFRSKAAAEAVVRESGLAWTIIRPTAYLETYVDIVGGPIAARGRAQIFGTGRRPIDFVSVQDVAALVVRALTDPSLRGRVLELGGEVMTMEALARALTANAGGTAEPRHVPRAALRVMRLAARPFSPFLARVAQAALVMDTVDLRRPMPDARSSVPDLPRTTLADVLAARRDAGAPLPSA